MKNYSLGPIVDHKFGSNRLNKLRLIIRVLLLETVNSKIDGSQLFDRDIISEDTDVSPRSQRTDPGYQLNVITLKEYYIGTYLK